MKVCSGCNINKDLAQYNKNKSVKKDGLDRYCRDCTKQKFVDWRNKNVEQENNRNRVWSNLNPDKVYDANKKWAKNNPEKRKLQRKRYYLKNKEKVRMDCKKYISDNFNKVAARLSQYRLNHIDELKTYYKQHLIENRSKYNSRNAKRRAAQKSASVSWACPIKIQWFYDEAQRLTEETGISHDVDHKIPLTHPKICGFHHEDNLQVITSLENGIKSNKFTPE